MRPGSIGSFAPYSSRWPIGAWFEKQKIVASDAEASDRFGLGVAMSGDGLTTVVGATREDPSSVSDAGAAYVFQRSGEVWSQTFKLTASTPQATAYFGEYVAINQDGTVIAVGAPFEDGSFLNSGAVYIYRWNGTSWDETRLVASPEKASATFGRGVALSASGNRLLVGAVGDTSNNGAMFVFDYAGGSWTQTDRIAPYTGAYKFANKIAMSPDGKTLFGTRVIGIGEINVFRQVGGVWTKVQNFSQRSNAQLASSFNGSVLASGDESTSRVYVYDELTPNTWTLRTTLNSTPSISGAIFGASVAISYDGNALLVGARESTGGVGSVKTGCAYGFVYSPLTSTWRQTPVMLTDPRPESLAQVGAAISCSSDGYYVNVGAYLENAGGLTDSGASYIYKAS